MAYLLLKLLHVVAAIIAVGTNVTYFFWLQRAKTAAPPSDVLLEGIQSLDRKLANPAYVVLPVTGIIMVLIGEIGFTTFWVATAIGLYIAMGAFAGIAFSPALRRQVELARAGAAADDYAAATRRTMVTGTITMLLIVAILYLMVVKPG